MNRLLLAALALALAFAGCAQPVPKQHSPPNAARVKADPFAGHYEGTWQSESSGHHGRLLCEFTPLDSHHYRAEFEAHWGMLSGHYSVVFETHRQGRNLVFQGEHDLGHLFGGIYHYQGSIEGTRFRSIYRSSADHGTFTMQRVAGH